MPKHNEVKMVILIRNCIKNNTKYRKACSNWINQHRISIHAGQIIELGERSNSLINKAVSQEPGVEASTNQAARQHHATLLIMQHLLLQILEMWDCNLLMVTAGETGSMQRSNGWNDRCPASTWELHTANQMVKWTQQIHLELVA